MKNIPDSSAIAEFKQIIKSYVWDGKEKEMLSMFTSDRKQFRKILSLYKTGKWKDAAKEARHMDTAPREYIPGRIWNDINGLNYDL